MALPLGLADVIILVIVTGAFLYTYATRKRNFWKNQNVPYEEFSLIFGPARRLLFKPMALTDHERYQKMGKLFGVYEGGKPKLVVAEPDLVKQVLVKDFHLLPNRRVHAISDPIFHNMMAWAPFDIWRKIRPAVTPAFSTARLRKMNALIQDCVRVTCEHLKAAAEQRADINVQQSYRAHKVTKEARRQAENTCDSYVYFVPFYGHYSLNVIARCAFGTTLDSHSDATNEFVTEARKGFSARVSWKVLLFVLFPGLLKYLKINASRGGTSQYFKEVCQRIIRDRRENGKRLEDFLQLMIDAQDGNLTASEETSADPENKIFDVGSDTKPEAPISTKRLTETEAMAQCVLFFLVGLETTSMTLALATYHLALNPAVQEKLRKEVDECMAEHGPEPSLDAIMSLKYLHCVVLETLRLYPPAPRVERYAIDDYVLDETGIKVPKNSSVIVPIYAMHRDPTVFPDPESFVPERFSDENVESIRPYTYLPFGAGPRNCIGMRLGLQSIKLCLIHTLHNVQFVRTEKTKVPVKIKVGFGMLTPEDLMVGVRRRPTQNDSDN